MIPSLLPTGAPPASLERDPTPDAGFGALLDSALNSSDRPARSPDRSRRDDRTGGPDDDDRVVARADDERVADRRASERADEDRVLPDRDDRNGARVAVGRADDRGGTPSEAADVDDEAPATDEVSTELEEESGTVDGTEPARQASAAVNPLVNPPAEPELIDSVEMAVDPTGVALVGAETAGGTAGAAASDVVAAGTEPIVDDGAPALGEGTGEAGGSPAGLAAMVEGSTPGEGVSAEGVSSEAVSVEAVSGESVPGESVSGEGSTPAEGAVGEGAPALGEGTGEAGGSPAGLAAMVEGSTPGEGVSGESVPGESVPEGEPASDAEASTVTDEISEQGEPRTDPAAGEHTTAELVDTATEQEISPDLTEQGEPDAPAVAPRTDTRADGARSAAEPVRSASLTPPGPAMPTTNAAGPAMPAASPTAGAMPTAVQRLIEVAERLREGTPPRSLTVEVPDMEGARVRVALTAAGLTMSVLGDGLDPERRELLQQELDQAMSQGGFSDSGRRRRDDDNSRDEPPAYVPLTGTSFDGSRVLRPLDQGVRL